VVRFNISYI